MSFTESAAIAGNALGQNRGNRMNLKTDERVIRYIRKKIKDSQNIVAVIGIEMLVEGGGSDLDSNDENYRIEKTYGYSTEDILSSSFYNAKAAKFYRFYKKEILGMNVDKTPAYDALLKLQAQGKLSAVISQNFHGIPKGISFQNVIELNGNFDSNKCPRCNKKFNMKYMIHTEGIPMCDRCKTAVRPDIRLLGERVNTILLTETELALEAADILLILGKNMYNDRLEHNLSLDHEQLRVLFSKDDVLSDRKVDFVIKDDISAVLPLIIE